MSINDKEYNNFELCMRLKKAGYPQRHGAFIATPSNRGEVLVCYAPSLIELAEEIGYERLVQFWIDLKKKRII